MKHKSYAGVHQSLNCSVRAYYSANRVRLQQEFICCGANLLVDYYNETFLEPLSCRMNYQVYQQ
ncbi:hypothetical protein EWB00_008279, partial [Schistosoma japonicum]